MRINFHNILGGLFHRLQVEEYSGQLFFGLNFEKFNTVFKWESTIKYEIRSYADLMAKYTKGRKDIFYIKHNTRSKNVNYKGILRPSLFVNCIPFLRRHIDVLLKSKKFFTKNLRKTDLKINVKQIIEKMRCISCGGKFEDYIGKERLKCSKCDNFLKIKDDIIIKDNAYKGINL